MPYGDALRLETDRKVASVTLLLVFLTATYFIRTDVALFLAGEASLALRLGVRLSALALIAWAILALRRDITRARYNRVMAIATGVSVVALLALNAMRPQGSVLPLRTPLLWLMAMYGGFVAPPRQQIIAPLVFTAGLILLRIFWVTSGAQGDMAGDIVVLVAVNAIGVIFVVQRAALAEREDGLLRQEITTRQELEGALAELRTLRGIIPICSYCKQVRSEVGDWQQIDRYVREHSHAEFSHGICPTCLEKHWGGA